MSEMERIDESRVTRRMAMGAFAAGVGALVLGPATAARADEESGGEHRVSWEDGWDYPLVGTDASGHWIVECDDGEYLVDPSGWVYDDATWYPISAVGADGIWYIGNDGFEYLLDGFVSSAEFLV